MATTAAALMVEFKSQGAGEVKRDLADVGAGVNAAGAKSKAGGMALLGFAGAVAVGFGAAVKSAMSFEQGMSGVAAALGGVGTSAGITKDQFAALDAEALRIGETTTQSATGAAQAMELLAKAGIGVDEILNGAAQAAVNLSEATGEQLAQSAETMAAMLTLFQDVDAGRAADILTTAMNNSSATMSELQTGLVRLAPVIAQTGMSFEDSAASIAFFNSLGLGAAETGTSLTAAFNNVTQPTNEAAQAMADMGIAAYDAQGQFVGFPDLFDQLATATAGMTEEQRTAALGMIFGADAMDVIALALANGTEEYDRIRAAMDETGTAAEASAIRMDNLSGDVENLKGALESAAITIGRMLTPALRKVTQGLARFISGFLNLPRGTQRVLAAIVGIAAAVAGLAGILGLAAAGVGPFAAGLGIIGAAIGLLLSPIGLLAAALIGLAVVFRGPIGDGIAELGDRLGEFVGDVKDVYDRLRGVEPIFDSLGNVIGETEPKVSAANAAIRAFGSGLEDLTSIEMSAWFFDMSQAVDAFIAAWGDRDIGAMIEAALDVGELVFDVTISIGELIWGGIKSGVGNLWDWIKMQVLNAQGGPVGDQTGGPQPFGGPGTIDLGDVTVFVGSLIWGGVKSAFGSIRDWVREQLGIGGFGGTRGDSSDNAMSYTMPPVIVNVLDFVEGQIKDAWEWAKPRILGDEQPEVDIPPPTVNVPAEGTINDDDWWDYVDRALEANVGVDIELQDFNFHLRNEPGNLQIADFWSFVDKSMQEFIGVDIELQDWTLHFSDSGIAEAVPDVVERIDASLEEMFAGGHDIELQNPIADLAGMIADWARPVIDAIDEQVRMLRGAWARFTAAANPPATLVGGNAWGGTRGNEEFPINLVGVPNVDHAATASNVDQAVMAERESAARAAEGLPPLEVVVDIKPTYRMLNPDIGPTDLEGGVPSGSAGGHGAPEMIFKATLDTTELDSKVAEALASFDTFTADTGSKGQAAAEAFNTGFKLDPAVSHAGAVQASLAAIFSGIAADATNFGAVAGEGFNSGIVSGTSQAVAAAGAAANGLSGIFIGIATTATNMGIAAGQGFASGLWAGMSEAVAAAGAGAAGIVNALSLDLYGLGASASFSFAAGLQAGVGAAQQAASQLAQAAASAVASQLLIRSPSRVMMGLGEETVEGFLIPLRQGQGAVARAMGSLVGAPDGLGLAAAGFGGGPLAGMTTNHNSNVRIGQVVVRNGDDFERKFLNRSRALTLARERG